MSRVRKPGNKYMNTAHHDSSITGPSKMVRVHSDREDYHKSKTLSTWLFIKYDMSYKTYRNKSKNRRADTGIVLGEKRMTEADYEYEKD